MTWCEFYGSALEAGYLPEAFWAMTLHEYLHHSKHFENQDRAAWLRTASTQSLLANINRRKGSNAFTLDDFNPYAAADQEDARQKQQQKTKPVQPAFFQMLGDNLKT